MPILANIGSLCLFFLCVVGMLAFWALSHIGSCHILPWMIYVCYTPALVVLGVWKRVRYTGPPFCFALPKAQVYEGHYKSTRVREVIFLLRICSLLSPTTRVEKRRRVTTARTSTRKYTRRKLCSDGGAVCRCCSCKFKFCCSILWSRGVRACWIVVNAVELSPQHVLYCPPPCFLFSFLACARVGKRVGVRGGQQS